MIAPGELGARFWCKVDGADRDGCWTWTAGVNTHGYGQYWVKRGRLMVAHRMTYLALVGPIPEGLQLDHLCRNRRCVNPAHLELVTSRENTLRGEGVAAACAKKTHCPQGHPYDLENTYWYRRKRYCRACGRARDAIRYARTARGSQ